MRFPRFSHIHHERDTLMRATTPGAGGVDTAGGRDTGRSTREVSGVRER